MAIKPKADEKVILPVFKTQKEAEAHMMEYAAKMKTLPEFEGYGLIWSPRSVAGGFALVAAPLDDPKGKKGK